MDYGWILRGLCMDRVRILSGLCMDRAWIMHGLSLDYARILYGSCVDYLWIMHGLRVDCDMFILAQEGPSPTRGRFWQPGLLSSISLNLSETYHDTITIWGGL